MAGRPQEFNNEKVLEKAAAIFWKIGYESASTQDLLKGMGLNKGSLYNSFGSKRDLFCATLKYYSDKALQDIDLKIAESKDALEGISSFFLDLARAATTEHDKGCFMGNTLAEMAGRDEELRKDAAVYLLDLEKLFFKYLSIAKAQGSLSSDADLELLAKYLLNIWNGINITRRVYQEPAILKAIMKMQLDVLKAGCNNG